MADILSEYISTYLRDFDIFESCQYCVAEAYKVVCMLMLFPEYVDWNLVCSVAAFVVVVFYWIHTHAGTHAG